MEIFTYINFLGTSEAAQTGDNINLALILLIGLALIIAGALCYVLRSKRISSAVKKIIGIGLPSIFLVLAIPMIVVGQSWAAGSSTSVNAIVDTDNGLAYIENGTIQNTTEDDMQLIVSNSKATNAGLNIPGLQNANLIVNMGTDEVFNGNPFDDYETNMYLEIELKPGQAIQFSSELTGLDKQTAEALEGSGNSIQIRFKFYYSMVDKEYGPSENPAPVGDYLYETEYDSWDVDKTNFLCECMAKREWWYAPDSPEYKEYLRKEWGCNDEQIAYIIALRKYIEGSNPYVGLCTSCRHDNLIGRNFDWAYDDLNEYVMRTTAKDNRYKSIGIVSSFFPQALQDALHIEAMLPMLTMDGINSNGVAININVVPSNFDDTIGTNPGKERLCAGVIPRFVLDNATSANHAVELLKNRDIYTIFLSEFHFMISDANETYIVETVHNQLVVLKQEKAKGDTAMANFHVTNSEFYDDYDVYYGDPKNYGPAYSKGAMGIERYNKAITGLASVTTLDNMVEHMKPIYYEHVYKDGYTFWSDKNGMPSAVEYSDHEFSYYDDYGEEKEKWAAERRATFDDCKNTYDTVHGDEKVNGWRLDMDQIFNGVTQTVHASCYDLSAKELVVNVQERDVSFHFSLDGKFREKGGEYAAEDLYVNGDNVGLAKSCNAEDSVWELVGNTLTLKSKAVYSITGTNPNNIQIVFAADAIDGWFVKIPKVENAVAKVEFAETSAETNLTLAPGRMGTRAVPKGYYVKITFTADDGYKFVESGKKTYEVEIKNGITQDITFDETQGFDTPTAYWDPTR